MITVTLTKQSGEAIDGWELAEYIAENAREWPNDSTLTHEQMAISDLKGDVLEGINQAIEQTKKGRHMKLWTYNIVDWDILKECGLEGAEYGPQKYWRTREGACKALLDDMNEQARELTGEAQFDDLDFMGDDGHGGLRFEGDTALHAGATIVVYHVTMGD